MEKQVKIHEDYRVNEDCKFEHPAWLFIGDESSLYSSAAENKYYAKAICLECGLIDSYELSIGERRRCVYLPFGFNPYLCFSEVHQRYLELISMYEPKTIAKYEEVVKRINFEIKRLYPSKKYDVEQRYLEQKDSNPSASQETIFFSMSRDIQNREAEILKRIEKRFLELQSLGLTSEDIFERIGLEYFEDYQPEKPKDSSVLGLIRKKKQV